MGLLLLIVLLLLLLGAFPRWNHSREWGYMPAGGLGILLLIVIVLALLGSIPWYGWSRPVYVRPTVIDRRPIHVINPPAQPASQPQPSSSSIQ